MQHHDLSEPSKNCGRNGSHSAWWTGWRYHHRRVYKPSLLAIKELQSEIWRKAFEAVHKCFGLSVTLFVRHCNAGVRGLSPKHVQAVFVGIDLQDTCKKQRFPDLKGILLLKQVDLVLCVFSQSTPRRQSPEKLILEEWIAGETPEVFQNTKTLTHLWKMSLTLPVVLQNVFSVRVFLEKIFRTLKQV